VYFIRFRPPNNPNNIKTALCLLLQGGFPNMYRHENIACLRPIEVAIAIVAYQRERCVFGSLDFIGSFRKREGFSGSPRYFTGTATGCLNCGPGRGEGINRITAGRIINP